MSNFRKRLVPAAAAVFGLAAASPAQAQDLPGDLYVHGFLSQGYVQSSDLPIMGIGEEGSADYRSAALQARWAATAKDHFVVQVSHRRLGASPITDGDAPVQLDWAFYQRRLPAGFSAKVGRFAAPLGIFNETRDVGTLHPFYRAPANTYMEGFENLVGGALSNYLAVGGGWSVESSAYGGRFDYVGTGWKGSEAGMKQVRTEYDLTPAYGAQVWLNTPVTGVRVGASSLWFTADEFGVEDEMGTSVYLSAAGDFSRVYARAEAKRITVGPNYESPGYYVQAGVRLPGGFSVNGQVDAVRQKIVAVVPTPAGPHRVERDYEQARDVAVGVNYAFKPNLVFKFEGHRTRGYNYDQYHNPFGPAGEGDYFIGSVSASF